MRLIRGLSRAQVEGIERAQQERPFTSVADLARRSGAARVTLFRLAAADAMQSLGLDRRQAAWEVLALGADPQMFEEYEPIEPTPALPELSLEDTVREDYSTIGLSLHAHPMALIREDLARLGAQPTRILQHTRHGQWVTVAGMVLVRQRPSTASGVVFCTLEDETGIANLIIRPQYYEKYRRTARGAAVLVAKGRVERQGDVIHLNVTHLSDASRKAPAQAKSRDFH